MNDEEQIENSEEIQIELPVVTHNDVEIELAQLPEQSNKNNDTPSLSDASSESEELKYEKEIQELKTKLNQHNLDKDVLHTVLSMYDGDVDSAYAYLRTDDTDNNYVPPPPPPPATNGTRGRRYRHSSMHSSAESFDAAPVANVRTYYVPPTTWDANPEIHPPADFQMNVTFDDIDEDALFTILTFCDKTQYLILGSTSRRYQEITSQNRYWKHLLGDSKLQLMKTLASTETHNLKNMLQFDGFRSKIDEAPPSMVMRAYKDSVENQSENLLEFNYKEQLAVFNRIKGLENRRQILIANKTSQFNNTLEEFNEKMWIAWIVFLVFLAIGILTTSILTPLYMDGTIPKTSYYWLIPYGPVFILVPYFVIMVILNVKFTRYVPLWTRRQMDFHPVGRYDDVMHFDWFVFTATAFTWPVWLLLGVFIKLIALQSYAVWTYVMIPTYVAMFGNYICHMPSGTLVTKRRGWTKEYVTGAVGTFLLYTFLSLGIALVAAKNDGFSTMTNVPWSTTFIPFYICLILLQVFIVLVFYMSLMRNDDWCQYKPLMIAFGWEVLATFFTAPVFTSFLLVGLILDNVTPSLPYIAALAPFYGCYVIYCCIAAAVGIGICVCISVSGNSD